MGGRSRKGLFRERERFGPGLKMESGPLQTEDGGEHSVANMKCVRGVKGRAKKKSITQTWPELLFPGQGFPPHRVSLNSRMRHPPGTLRVSDSAVRPGRFGSKYNIAHMEDGRGVPYASGLTVTP